jgi:hypothetical protein
MFDVLLVMIEIAGGIILAVLFFRFFEAILKILVLIFFLSVLLAGIVAFFYFFIFLNIFINDNRDDIKYFESSVLVPFIESVVAPLIGFYILYRIGLFLVTSIIKLIYKENDFNSSIKWFNGLKNQSFRDWFYSLMALLIIIKPLLFCLSSSLDYMYDYYEYFIVPIIFYIFKIIYEKDQLY